MTPLGSPPPAPPPPIREEAAARPRHGCRRALLLAGGLTGLVGVVALVAVVVLARRLSTPQAVPADFRPPTALPASPDVGSIPPGQLVFDSDRTGNFEIFTMSADGRSPRQLTNDSRFDSWWGRISPDRRTLLFYRSPKGTHDRDYSRTSLWAMGADGSAQTLLRPAGLDGWVFQGHAEWSPDGANLVMFGGSRISPQIQLTDPLGRGPRAVTQRDGANLDPSFSPDGKTIVFVGCPGRLCTPVNQEIYTVPTTGGSPTRLTQDSTPDFDPYYSPDGKRLAWLSETTIGLPGVWDIRVAGVDGTGVHRLIGDGNVNSRPEWSADSRSIYFHRLVIGSAGGFQIWVVQLDGSGLREITANQQGTNEYPST